MWFRTEVTTVRTARERLPMAAEAMVEVGTAGVVVAEEEAVTKSPRSVQGALA